MDIKIKNRYLGNFSKPYVIAEIGSNFNQSFQTAINLIDAVKKAGANAAKFQLLMLKNFITKAIHYLKHLKKMN